MQRHLGKICFVRLDGIQVKWEIVDICDLNKTSQYTWGPLQVVV